MPGAPRQGADRALGEAGKPHPPRQAPEEKQGGRRNGAGALLMVGWVRRGPRDWSIKCEETGKPRWCLSPRVLEELALPFGGALLLRLPSRRRSAPAPGRRRSSGGRRAEGVGEGSAAAVGKGG